MISLSASMTAALTTLADQAIAAFAVHILVLIPAAGIFLSSRKRLHRGAWLCGEGLMCGDFMLCGWNYEDADNGIFSGLWLCGEGQSSGDLLCGQEHANDLFHPLENIGQIAIQLAESSGLTRVSTMTVQVSNRHGWHHALGQIGYFNVHNQRALVKVGAQGTSYFDYTDVFAGVVDDIAWTPEIVTLTLTSGKFLQQRDLNYLLTEEHFPGTLDANESRAVPLLMGRLLDVETIVISSAVTGTLAFAMTSAQTFAVLNEFAAAFPATGTFTIESETGITYTSRSTITTNGVTYLYLSGLTRGGTPATHAVSQTVTLTSVAYQHLIGNEVNSVDVVRNNGTPTSSYTFVRANQRGNRFVSYLEFSSAQGTVTADVNGVAFTQGNLLLNPSFETGTTANWTLESGGATTVDNTPAPALGSYQVDLTGVQGGYRALYQDVAVQPNALHTLQIYHQDQQATLGTNLGFESGSFTGWTITDTASIASVKLAPPGQEYLLCRDGSYYADFLASGTVTLYQDVTVSNATQYVFTFWYQQRNTGYGVFHQRGTIKFSLGTTTNAGAYVDQGALTDTLTNDQDLGYQQAAPSVFTTTSTTLRITFSIICATEISGSGQVPSTVMHARLDALSLQLGSGQDTSYGALQIGTTGTPGAYVDTALPLIYAWQPAEYTFTPTASPVRISLRGAYTGTSTPTHFDNCSLVQNSSTLQSAAPMSPGAAIAYWMDTLVPNMHYDKECFDLVDQTLVNYRLSGYVSAPGDSDTFLATLAEHASCFLVENSVGEMCLILKPTPGAGTPVFTLTRETNIFGIALESAPSDDAYTHYVVRYGQKVRGTTGTGDNALGTVYCDPDKTSHPLGSTLTSLCKALLTTDQREITYSVYMPYLNDLETAHEFLRRKVRIHATRRQYDVMIQANFTAIPVEIGDIVQVEDDILPYPSQKGIGWVRAKTLNLADGTINLIVRTMRELVDLSTPIVAPPPVVSGVAYYVSATGSDGNDGSFASPWATLAHAFTVVQPGETIYMRGGTYNQYINGMPSGTSWSEAITIRAYQDEVPILQPSEQVNEVINLPSESYIIFDGITIDAALHADGSGYCVSLSSSGGHHIRFQNCDIKNAYSVLIHLGISDEVLNCRVHGSRHSYGFYCQYANAIIDGCKIYDNAGYAVQIYNGYAPNADNIIVSNNYMWNNGIPRQVSTVTVDAGESCKIFNNVIWDGYGGIDVHGYAEEVYNNTIYGNSPRAAIELSYGENTIVKNNIVWGNAAGIADYGTPGLDASNNLDTDPDYVDRSNGDFHLQSTSDAIDAGATIALVTRDIEGIIRPQGGSALYDIGAYEYHT